MLLILTALHASLQNGGPDVDAAISTTKFIPCAWYKKALWSLSDWATIIIILLCVHNSQKCILSSLRWQYLCHCLLSLASLAKGDSAALFCLGLWWSLCSLHGLSCRRRLFHSLWCCLHHSASSLASLLWCGLELLTLKLHSGECRGGTFFTS